MYLDLFPSIVREWEEFQSIGKVADIENLELSRSIVQLENDQFIHSLTPIGASRHEKMLGIESIDTDTIEERRFRIFAEVNKTIPYTKRTLDKLLMGLCGKGNYIVQLDPFKKNIQVKINLVAKSMFEKVCEVLEDIVPLNMTLSVLILYNNHETLGQFTHEQLEKYTHLDVREEVIK